MAVSANHEALPTLSPRDILQARKDLASAQKAGKTVRQQGYEEGLREGKILTLEQMAARMPIVNMGTKLEHEFTEEDFPEIFGTLHEKEIETFGDLTECDVVKLLDLCGDYEMVVEIIFRLSDHGLRVKARTAESA